MLPAGVINLSIFLLATFISFAASSSAATTDAGGDCVYTVYIETGCNRKAGTDSVISLALSSEPSGNGAAVKIADLMAWGGLMGANHDYFDRNNLDVFSARGPCLPGPPCWMELSSDGVGGIRHRWYCNYLEVTVTGPHMNCTKQLFTVEQWLARDRVPYQLSAARDYCGGGGNHPEAAGAVMGQMGHQRPNGL